MNGVLGFILGILRFAAGVLIFIAHNYVASGIAFIVIALVGSVLLMWGTLRYQRIGRSIMVGSGKSKKWKRSACPDCEGCGAVMLDGSAIPTEWRTYSGGEVRSSIANTKTCDSCHGIGLLFSFKD